jgi:hypothetical protein
MSRFLFTYGTPTPFGSIARYEQRGLILIWMKKTEREYNLNEKQFMSACNVLMNLAII